MILPPPKPLGLLVYATMLGLSQFCAGGGGGAVPCSAHACLCAGQGLTFSIFTALCLVFGERLSQFHLLELTIPPRLTGQQSPRSASPTLRFHAWTTIPGCYVGARDLGQSLLLTQQALNALSHLPSSLKWLLSDGLTVFLLLLESGVLGTSKHN